MKFKLRKEKTMRNVINFNDNWKFIQKDVGLPTEFPCDWSDVTLPHTWNAYDGQDGGNDYFRGTCLYKKTFKLSDIKISPRNYKQGENYHLNFGVIEKTNIFQKFLRLYYKCRTKCFCLIF